jgi:hypothetical protein
MSQEIIEETTVHKSNAEQVNSLAKAEDIVLQSSPAPYNIDVGGPAHVPQSTDTNDGKEEHAKIKRKPRPPPNPPRSLIPFAFLILILLVAHP